MNAITIKLSPLHILLLAILGGVATSFAFPSQNIYILAFVSFVPLSVIIYSGKTRQVVLGTLLYCFAFFGLLLFWIASWLLKEVPMWVALFAPVFIILLITSYYIVTALIASYFGKRFPFLRPFILAASFTVLEYLRTIGFLGFPWGIFGYSQATNLPFIQIADVTGVLGITFILYFVNAVIADLITKKMAGYRLRKIYFSFPKVLANDVFVAVLLIALAFGYGAYRLGTAPPRNKPDPTRSTIALVQKNFDPNYRWYAPYTNAIAKPPSLFMDTSKVEGPDPAAFPPGTTAGTVTTMRLVDLMKEAALEDPSLIVFSETAFLDFYRYTLPAVKPHLTNMTWLKASSYRYNIFLMYQGIRDTGKHVLLGAPDARLRKEDEKALSTSKYVNFNAAFHVLPTGEVYDTYAKKKKVPFAEAYPFYNNMFIRNTPPFKWFLDFMYKAVEDSGGGQWGEWPEYTVIKHPAAPYSYSVLICYEGTFGDFSRTFVKDGANALINITDDAWSYSDTSQLEHFMMYVFRAIENRRDVFRAGNCGKTAHIDPYGRVVKSIPMWEPGVMTSTFIPQTKKTFYTKYGEVFTLVIAIALGVIFLVHLIPALWHFIIIRVKRVMAPKE